MIGRIMFTVAMVVAIMFVWGSCQLDKYYELLPETGEVIGNDAEY